MKLINFFEPLNLHTISEYIVIFLFFDILGTFIKKIFIKTKEDSSRVLNWLIGLAIFVLIWFCLSLFIPYSNKNVIVSIVLMLVVTLPGYIKNFEYKSLIYELWSLRLPLLIVLPFLPAVFVKASLPPYYSDEMAYHFISPFAVTNLTAIKYVGGIYADLPRMMNMFYEIIFSLTHTYSIARLFHFSILVTSLAYTYKILKINFKWYVGFMFMFVFLSLPQDIVLTSTLGYIDVAAYSFVLIAISSLVWLIKKPSVEPLFLTIIFWSMNLGTKYTGVSTFVVFASLLAVTLYFYWNELKSIFKFKNIIIVSTLFIIFGGYWYAKNFIWFGNPIFPFLFKCWGTHVEPCPQAGGFFGDWTTKINIGNIYLILSQLFVKNKVLHIATVATPLFAIFIKDRKSRFIVFFMLASVALELFILKYFSGFYVRYQQHMQLYLLMAIVITLSSEIKIKFVNMLSKVLLMLVILSSIAFYGYTVKYTNSLKFLNWNEINYSIGRSNIYDWINFNFPRMNETIRWCEERDADGNIKKLARFDPDLIWFDYDGLKRVFMLNCDYINPPLYSEDVNLLMPSAKDQKLKFYIASVSRCLPDDKVVKLHPTERDDMLVLRKINNKIICNSEEIKPYLYYFDYTKIK